MGSALFYGATSVAVVFLNKMILSEYKFGDFVFVSLSQFVATVLALLVLHALRKVEIPMLTRGIFIEIAPVAGMFMGNVVSGLGSTRALSLPVSENHCLTRFHRLLSMLHSCRCSLRSAGSAL